MTRECVPFFHTSGSRRLYLKGELVSVSSEQMGRRERSKTGNSTILRTRAVFICTQSYASSVVGRRSWCWSPGLLRSSQQPIGTTGHQSWSYRPLLDLAAVYRRQNPGDQPLKACRGPWRDHGCWRMARGIHQDVVDTPPSEGGRRRRRRGAAEHEHTILELELEPAAAATTVSA